MGFDIKVKTEQFTGNEDRSWLGARLNTEWMPRSITLDVSVGFLAAHVNVKGAIPSGTALGKITASGLYGPYDPYTPATDGRQTAAGLLFNTTKVGDGTGTDLATAGDVGAPLFWAGVVKASKLPTFSGTSIGTLDAGAKATTVLGNFIRFE